MGTAHKNEEMYGQGRTMEKMSRHSVGLVGSFFALLFFLVLILGGYYGLVALHLMAYTPPPIVIPGLE